LRTLNWSWDFWTLRLFSSIVHTVRTGDKGTRLLLWTLRTDLPWRAERTWSNRRTVMLNARRTYCTWRALWACNILALRLNARWAYLANRAFRACYLWTFNTHIQALIESTAILAVHCLVAFALAITTIQWLCQIQYFPMATSQIAINFSVFPFITLRFDSLIQIVLMGFPFPIRRFLLLFWIRISSTATMKVLAFTIVKALWP
jgi:hypothetical protein